MHKPVLIIIAGPNGSGKTSITSQIIQHDWMEDSLYINPDNIAQEMFGDWNSAEAVMKAAKYSEELREQCLRERKSLIFENVPITKIISRYQKSIANCCLVSRSIDRTYVYDNSVDFSEARLLFRLTDGKMEKQYTEIIPDWAQPILP